MRAGVVRVVEEGEVDQAGTVVEGGEDDAAAGADRRGLGGRLGARDQHRLPVPRLAQPLGRHHAQLAQEGAVVVHQVARGVHGQHAQFGTELLRRGEVGQPGGGGLPSAGQGELVAPSAPGAAVQFGQVQLQVAAVGAERVQRADLGEPPGQRPAGAGAFPEVEQGGVGLPGGDAFRLGLADAVHVREGEAQAPRGGLARTRPL